jgi:putative nucleotidyltransferase with HDIG domain
LTIRMAASFLGLDVIKNVVLSMETFQAFEKIPAIPGFSLDELQAHCRFTAAIIGQMQLPNDVRDAAIVAALLHDIGKLVIAYKMPDRFARLVARANAEQKPLYRIEEELWGITHAEVGAYLLGLWGLPIRVTEAIAYHHSPSAVPHQRFDALAAVYVANLLAHETEGSATNLEWDLGFLESFGVAGQLPDWRTMVSEMALLQQDSSQSPLEPKSKQRIPVA